MLDFKNKPSGFIKSHLKRVGIFVFEQDGNYECFPPYRETEAQEIIDRVMPDLDPVQFHFLLNRFQFDDVITPLLVALKEYDITQYAIYKAYLGNARVYEFEKTIEMLNTIKDSLLAVDSGLDFTLEQLKDMWLSVLQV